MGGCTSKDTASGDEYVFFFIVGSVLFFFKQKRAIIFV